MHHPIVEARQGRFEKKGKENRGKRALCNSFWLSILFQKSVSRSSCYEQKFAKATTLLLESNTPSVLEKGIAPRFSPSAINIFSRSWREWKPFWRTRTDGGGGGARDNDEVDVEYGHWTPPLSDARIFQRSSQTGGILDIRLSGCSHFRSASRVTILSIGRYARERERKQGQDERSNRMICLGQKGEGRRRRRGMKSKWRKRRRI